MFIGFPFPLIHERFGPDPSASHSMLTGFSVNQLWDFVSQHTQKTDPLHTPNLRYKTKMNLTVLLLYLMTPTKTASISKPTCWHSKKQMS